MPLYKATAKGQVEMTAEEEAQIRADWARVDNAQDKPKPKTLEERVTALEEIMLGMVKK